MKARARASALSGELHAAPAQRCLAFHLHLTRTGDIVPEAEELADELLVARDGDEAVVEEAAEFPEDLGAHVGEAA